MGGLRGRLMKELSEGASEWTEERLFKSRPLPLPPPPLQHLSLCVCILGSRSFRNGSKIEGAYRCRPLSECVFGSVSEGRTPPWCPSVERIAVCFGVLVITSVEFSLLPHWHTHWRITSLVSPLVLSIFTVGWFSATWTTVKHLAIFGAIFSSFSVGWITDTSSTSFFWFFDCFSVMTAALNPWRTASRLTDSRFSQFGFCFFLSLISTWLFWNTGQKFQQSVPSYSLGIISHNSQISEKGGTLLLMCLLRH